MAISDATTKKAFATNSTNLTNLYSRNLCNLWHLSICINFERKPKGVVL